MRSSNRLSNIEPGEPIKNCACMYFQTFGPNSKLIVCSLGPIPLLAKQIGLSMRKVCVFTQFSQSSGSITFLWNSYNQIT